MNSRLIKLFKYFAAAYLVSFLALNWSEVSWVFNYTALARYTSDLADKIAKEKQIAMAESDKDGVESKKANSVEIPKIKIEAPLIVDKGLDYYGVFRALDRGTVYYPESALPGQEGRTIILGHSAPQRWPKIRYDWVFSELNELQEGDEIFLHFNGKKYAFKVKNKIFLDRGDQLPEPLTNSERVLVLVSCWPPGKDIMRIAVVAEST
ncbi:MAG: putative sortase [Parcubacteria group bacterium Gr01-1014_30]|nr:MAG: putative sortase [Parcubacteria group bacterium Gr01-1014_30]